MTSKPDIADMQSKIDDVIFRRLDQLLLLEKERRGVSKDTLVFIGIANVANSHWCSMKSVLQSRSEEWMFFTAYLKDRLLYAYLLGMFEKLPRQSKELLTVGSQITQEHIEGLLKRVRIKKSRKPIDSDRMKAKLQRLDWRVRGEKAERMLAKSYSSLEWNFAFGRYVAVGIPDGVTDSFVYEFKSTTRPDYIQKVKDRAFTQADLYSYFFRRPKKVVEVYVIPNRQMETWEGDADPENAKRVLECFGRIDGGWLPPAPEKHKCWTCEFHAECQVPEKGPKNPNFHLELTRLALK